MKKVVDLTNFNVKEKLKAINDLDNDISKAAVSSWKKVIRT